MSRVVLVTGVSRDLGARVARALAGGGRQVVGVDLTAPRHPLEAVTFVRADLRTPVITGVLDRHRVDTVVHCALQGDDAITSPAVAKEANIFGTMQLMAACHGAPSVRHVVVRSTGQVYGASPLDPACFTEDTAMLRPPRSGVGRDAMEMESLAQGLGRRRPEVAVTILRLASLMGAHIDSPLTRWLSMPLVPRPWGFNARLQFLHPADAVAAVGSVVEQEVSGIFNVAAQDTLTLNQVLRILGRPSLWLARNHLGLQELGQRSSVLRFTPDQVRTVTWGRLIDGARLRTATGFIPHYSSRRALEEFAAYAPLGLLAAERFRRAIAQVTRVLA